jgi:hypothetical protein
LQFNYVKFELNQDLSKYRLFFIITLFLICTVNISFIVFSPEMMVKPDSHLFGNEKFSKNDQNLELKTDDSTSTPSGLKVEIISISGPLSFDSKDDHISNFNLQIKIYSKKKYSIISHSTLFTSKTLRLSPLITRLQI